MQKEHFHNQSIIGLLAEMILAIIARDGILYVVTISIRCDSKWFDADVIFGEIE